MSTIRIKRGLAANRLSQTPLVGELMYTTDDKRVFIGDGSTAGGVAVGDTAADILAKLLTVDGPGSGLDADKLDGLVPAEASTGNSIGLRTGEGDLNVRMIRSEYDTPNSTINYVMTQVDTATNNYVRPSTIAQLRTSLNVEDGSTGDLTGSEILALLLPVDGSGSGLDADTLDGGNSSQFVQQALSSNLTVGYTTDVEVLNNDTIAPDMQTESLKTRATAGNVTINFPLNGNGICHIIFTTDGTDRAVTLGANVKFVTGTISTLTAGTVYLMTVIRDTATHAIVSISAVDA